MKTLTIIIFAAEFLIALFLFPGCFTKMYQKDVVKRGRYNYCEKPFNCNFNEGHFIGTENLGGGLYDSFVFKNLIQTDGDRYIKIALPHNEDDWHWHDEYEHSRTYHIPRRAGDSILSYESFRTPQEFDFDKSEWVAAEGVIISECAAEDFDGEKKVASARVSVPYLNSKLLFVACDFHSPDENEYQFAFFIPAKEVMSVYGKSRPFPAYIFSYLGYPLPVALDIVTSPAQLLLWWLFKDFSFDLGG